MNEYAAFTPFLEVSLAMSNSTVGFSLDLSLGYIVDGDLMQTTKTFMVTLFAATCLVVIIMIKGQRRIPMVSDPPSVPIDDENSEDSEDSESPHHDMSQPKPEVRHVGPEPTPPGFESIPNMDGHVLRGQSTELIAAVQEDERNMTTPYKSKYQDWARTWNENIHGRRYTGPTHDASGNEIPWHSGYTDDDQPASSGTDDATVVSSEDEPELEHPPPVPTH